MEQKNNMFDMYDYHDWLQDGDEEDYPDWLPDGDEEDNIENEEEYIELNY